MQVRATGPPIEWFDDMGEMLCMISLCSIVLFGTLGSLLDTPIQSLVSPFTSHEVSSGMVSNAIVSLPPNYPLLL